MFRFTIRELLWLTLVVAALLGWGLESHRSWQWRRRAEIAAGQLEAENLGRMVFGERAVIFHSPHKDAELREAVFHMDAN